MTSSSRANFRLDIFPSKTLLYFFGKVKLSKSRQNMQTLFTIEYLFTLSYFIRLHIAYEHTHLTPGSYTSATVSTVLSNCLIYQYQQAQL